VSELRELYQQVILDHNKSPRNRRALDGAQTADGHNPLCGDLVRIYVKLDGDRIVDVGFEGDGCAISTASASMMTESLKGKTLEEFRAIFSEFHNMVTGSPGEHAPTAALGKLAVFGGVCEFPLRVKCATLAWHTLLAALDESSSTISTE
jgi:nitrogen fixation NifU-like protein